MSTPVYFTWYKYSQSQTWLFYRASLLYFPTTTPRKHCRASNIYMHIYMYIYREKSVKRKKLNTSVFILGTFILGWWAVILTHTYIGVDTQKTQNKPHPWDTHYQFSIKTLLSKIFEISNFWLNPHKERGTKSLPGQDGSQTLTSTARCSALRDTIFHFIF